MVSQATITSYIRRPYKVRADGSFELVDERMHLVVGRGPFEVSVGIGDVTVE